MSDAVDRAFHELRLEYLASLPARLGELRADLAALRSGDAGIQALLKIRLHRLAGSGGSYGFAELSSIAREAEQLLAGDRSLGQADELDMLVGRLEQAADEAGKRIRE